MSKPIFVDAEELANLVLKNQLKDSENSSTYAESFLAKAYLDQLEELRTLKSRLGTLEGSWRPTDYPGRD